MLFDFLLADPECFGFLLAVFFHSFLVRIGSLAKNFLKRLYDFVFRNLFGLECNLTALNTSYRFNDNEVTHCKALLVGLKIINLAYVLKTYAYYVCHLYHLFYANRVCISFQI